VTVDIGTLPPGPIPEREIDQVRRRRRKVFVLLFLVLLLAILAGLAIWYLLFRQPLPLPPVPVTAVPSYSTSIYGASSPAGVAVTPSGDRIYVSETEGERVVRIFDNGGREIGILRPPLTTGSEHVPLYVAISPRSGEVFVTDRPTGSIYVYDRDGTYQREFRPEEVLAGWQPIGVTFDSAGNFYVTDLSGTQRILKFDPSGLLVQTLGAEERLAFPNGVAVDDDGLVYVTDSNNGRLLVFDATGTVISKIGRGAGAGNLGLPRGIAIDNKGRVFVVDTSGQGVLVFSTLEQGEQQLKRLGAFVGHGVGDGEFAFPMGIAVDERGRIYVADTANSRVQVWSY
jgi:DNA-binding beta-propeller fold protein YncE